MSIIIDKQSLHHYYLFWSGQQLSAAGSAIVSFAIIWWLTITTQSALILAISSALTFGTMMVVQFFSGYITDFLNRKKILVSVDMLNAVATTVLLYIFRIAKETVPVVLLILAVRGVFDGLHAPAKGAIIPTMVPTEELQRVNSLSSTARSIINLGSPALAALLVSLYSQQIWVVLLLDPLTFLVALVPLAVISIPDIRQEHKQGESLKSKFTGGLSFLQQSTGLLPLLFIFASFNFFITPVSVLSPLIVLSSRGFAASEFVFGLSIILSNLGFLVMSLILTKYTPKIRETSGIVFGFTIAIIGLVTIALSLHLNTLWLYLVGNTIIGLGFPIVNVYSSIIWQTQVPNTYQGRIISVRMIITTASLPVVMILTGLLAELVSFVLLFVVSISGFSVLLLSILLFSDFRSIDQRKEHQILTKYDNSLTSVTNAIAD